MTQSFLIGSKQIDFNPANLSAFGSLETAELTPVFQTDFVYGLNTQIWNTAVTSGTGATVDTDAARLRIQSGTDAAGYAYVTNIKGIKYRAGQGIVLRFTPVFTAGAADSVQFMGAGSIASNAPYDGYFFGYNGTAFGIAHYIRGSLTWIAQTAWNGQQCITAPFAYDPTKGTPVMIKYPYLGFGDIFFYLQNPTSGEWVLVHTIRYANTVATTQLGNPNLQFVGFTLNSGNTGNLTMYCGSIGGFISGVRSYIGNPRWAMDSYKTSITTETNILTLQNATTYNGIANRSLIRLSRLSFSSSANSGVAVARLKIGATLGGTPAYTPISGSTADNGVTITSGNSVASYDVAGTTVTGGVYQFAVIVDNPNTQTIDLLPYDLFIAPGQTATLSGFSTLSSTVGVAVNWSEDV